MRIKNNLKNFFSKYSRVFYLLYIVVFIELFSAFGLIILATSVKETAPQRRKDIFFSKYDLPHPLLSIKKIRNKSNQTYTVSDPNFGYYLSTLRFGDDREWITKKDILNKSINLFLFGGSTIEGDGVKSKEKTIAFQLERLLNFDRSSQCLPIKVFNEGISGFQSKQQFNLLTNAVLPRIRKEVDMVITVDGINDFLSYTSGRRISKSPFKKTLSTRELEMISISQEFFDFQSVKQRSNLLTRFSINSFVGRLSLSLNQLTKDSSKKILKDAWGHKADLGRIQFNISDRVKNYLYYVEIEKSLLDSLKIKNFRFLQPYIGYKKNLSPEEIFIRDKEKIYPKIFWKSFDEFYEKTRKSFPTYQNVIDMSDLFSNNEEQLFVDHVHYNSKGQFLIALKIKNSIEKQLPCFK